MTRNTTRTMRRGIAGTKPSAAAIARATRQAGLVAASVFITLGSAARAEDRNHHGNLCNPNNSTEAAKLFYTQFGVQNNSGTTANVHCGGTLEHASNITELGAAVYDRNPAVDVCCTFLAQDLFGSVIASGARCTSGTSSAVMILSWAPPSSSYAVANVQCSIPAVSGGSQSYITAFWVTTP